MKLNSKTIYKKTDYNKFDSTIENEINELGINPNDIVSITTTPIYDFKYEWEFPYIRGIMITVIYK